MNENLKAFLDKASEDDELKNRLAEVVGQGIEASSEAVAAIAREAGFDVNADDVKELYGMGGEELDEEELAQIAAAGASGGDTAPSEWTRSVCQCVVGGHGSKDDLQGVKEPCYCIQYGEGYDEYHYCNGRPEIVNCKCFHVGNGTAKMKRHTWG